MEAPNPRSTLSEALRTVLLHRRQMQEAKRLEERAEEKSKQLMSQRQPGHAGGVAAAPGTAAAVRAMFGMGPAPIADADVAAAQIDAADPMDEAGRESCGGSAADDGGRRSRGRLSEVRGAAGSASAMLRAARAPKAVAAGNWLTAMGSKSKKAKHRRVLEVDGEPLRLPEGVSASQTTGKLHFPVTFKFHEVRCSLPGRCLYLPCPCCAENQTNSQCVKRLVASNKRWAKSWFVSSWLQANSVSINVCYQQ